MLNWLRGGRISGEQGVQRLQRYTEVIGVYREVTEVIDVYTGFIGYRCIQRLSRYTEGIYVYRGFRGYRCIQRLPEVYRGDRYLKI